MFLRNIFLAATCLLFPSSALAAYLDLAWSPNSEPDLAGYVIYYGTSSGNYTGWTDVGKVTSARISGLSNDTEYFITLTAYDIYGNESDFSGEVSGFTIPGDEQAPGADFQARTEDGCFISSIIRPFSDN